MCDCHPSERRHPGLRPRLRPRLRLKKGVTRREVIEFGLAGAGLLALGPLTGRIPIASGSPLGNKVLIVLNLSGGNDWLNTVIPTSLASYAARRGALAIPPASALSLNNGPNPTTTYMLHPSMPKIQTLWTEGSVGLVNRVGYPTENLSHFSSQDIFSFAYRNAFPAGVPATGWIARYADLYAPTPMGAVAVGSGRPKDFTGGSSNPLMVSTLSQFQFGTDSKYPTDQASRIATVQSVLAGIPTGGLPSTVKDSIGAAYDLSAQIQTAATAYAANPGNATYVSGKSISTYMRDIATLIFGGFETRIFYTTIGGFDTHGGQGTTVGPQASLLADVDNAIGSFAADMKNMGQWNDVVVALITEFGRRNYPNGSGGTDHGHGQCMMLVGGAIAASASGGKKGVDLQDADIAAPAEYPLYAVDFRDVYREIVNDHLGANPAPVFPESQPSNGVWNVV